MLWNILRLKPSRWSSSELLSKLYMCPVCAVTIQSGHTGHTSLCSSRWQERGYTPTVQLWGVGLDGTQRNAWKCVRKQHHVLSDINRPEPSVHTLTTDM